MTPHAMIHKWKQRTQTPDVKEFIRDLEELLMQSERDSLDRQYARQHIKVNL